MRLLLALCTLLCAVAFADPGVEADLNRLRASVVQVFVVGQDEDYTRPWQRPRPTSWSGSTYSAAPRFSAASRSSNAPFTSKPTPNTTRRAAFVFASRTSWASAA